MKNKYKSDISSKIDYSNNYRILKRLFHLSILGVVLCIMAVFLSAEKVKCAVVVAGVLFIIPCYLYLYVLAILHWKERYVGNYSTLWGVLLVIETSGWLKIVYFFRHIIPDLKKRGRYRDIG